MCVVDTWSAQWLNSGLTSAQPSLITYHTCPSKPFWQACLYLPSSHPSRTLLPHLLPLPTEDVPSEHSCLGMLQRAAGLLHQLGQSRAEGRRCHRNVSCEVRGVMQQSHTHTHTHWRPISLRCWPMSLMMSESVSLRDCPLFRRALSSLPTSSPQPLARGTTPLLALPFSRTVPLAAACMPALHSACPGSLGPERRARLRGGGSNPPPSARWLPGEARAAPRHCPSQVCSTNSTLARGHNRLRGGVVWWCVC